MAVKRITYLTRRADLDAVGFARHWSTTHADIARRLPRVVAYRQNHIIWAPTAPRLLDVDGIVELWFEDEQAADAGFGSDIADLLIADETRFLDGLVGSAVDAEGPEPAHEGKLWILLPETDRQSIVDLTEALGRRHCAAVAYANIHAPAARVLSRLGLTRQALPAAAIALGFLSREAARSAVEAETRAPSAGLESAQFLVADVVSVI
ncbi:EthD family reductase [Microbacterium sp. 179-B 1A2 NHS]|uniref:EthD family reductase n=1 Tax=Microbacterium sp. 179-B 1A2 NHS TaxID=3142383 RepID=UPI0039A37E68